MDVLSYQALDRSRPGLSDRTQDRPTWDASERIQQRRHRATTTHL